MTSTVIETSSDPDLEIDGILLDEMLEFLNTSQLGEDAPHKVADIVFQCLYQIHVYLLYVMICNNYLADP